MLSKSILGMAVLARFAAAQEASVHGAGALGTVMGPVAFLWPADRAWDGAHDNTGPCGSNAAIINRTLFPIGSMGSIETTIAADASKMAIRIAYGNNPTSQTEFQDTQGNVTELEPGHQCYPIKTDAEKVTPGSNATIQIEYQANDSGAQETFFACADISATFDAKNAVCFNVSESEFVPAGTKPATTPVSSGTAASSPPTVPIAEKSDSGLSVGAKAGIAVGAILGAALIAGLAFFALSRKRSVPKDAEAQPPMGKVVSRAASIGSALTAH
ncbi:uncharacterized protein RSE6_11404 [Rhynchosporium secalis]|uniref:Copper acquisition factor BIM1-like domain-containing protein n=1 Tax=Rhynchosporium secalis TaxID=38038 RepID=A0A1E1MNU5_RHYSE|nr:uncharacterized protein RSE6_11404 [Rhynchosporium secalis]